MSEQKKMDEFFRDSFSNYSPNVPSHIWENIAAEKRKKKPAGFWYNKKYLLLLAIGLLVISSAALLIFQHNNINTNLPANANNQAAEQTASATTAGKASPSGGPVTTLPSDQQNKLTTAEDNIAASTSVNSLQQQASDNHVSNTKSTTGIAGNDQLITDNSNDFFRHRQQKSLAKKGRSTMAQRVAVADAVSFDQSAADDAVDNTNNAVPVEPGIDFAIPVLQGSREQIFFSSSANKTITKTVIGANIVKVPDCPLAEKDAAANKSYIEAYISPDYAVKNYTDTANSLMVQKRKESLRFQSAYSAGIRYTKVFSNGMSIRAGINYSQVNEKFSFIKDNVVQLVYVISPQGDTTSSYYVRGTRYSNTYNHYRTVDVPVVIGYELGNGRLHANINAGVVLNIRSWQSGQTLDENYMPVNISSSKNGNTVYQYKTNVGVGFTGAVSLYYKLNDRFHLLAEPYGRFNVSPMNNAAVSLQEKFTSIGLRLGLRMDL